MIENLDKIKAAIEIETKYRYIDVHGKTQKFSSFIKSEAKKNYKRTNKNPRWALVIEAFEVYPYASVPDRRKSIDCLIRTIKADLQQEAQAKEEENLMQLQRQKHPSQVDVMYVKGVGPKVGYKFNKLGIFTAQDLMMYFPKKHIDYSSRTLIKNLEEGQTTTVFGYIKSVSTFNTRNNLSVTKVLIKDESGRFELSFFNAKGNRFVLERMKSQFPVNAGIMVSGVVKRNNYDNQLTMDKPTYSIMSGEFMEDSVNNNLNLARIVPIYTVCEGLSIKTLRKAIFNAIELYKEEIVNIIPDFIRERLGLMDKKIAVQQIHFPDSMSNLERARFSLIF